MLQFQARRAKDLHIEAERKVFPLQGGKTSEWLIIEASKRNPVEIFEFFPWNSFELKSFAKHC